MNVTFEQLDLEKLTPEQRMALFHNLLDFFSAENNPLPEWVQKLAGDRLTEIDNGNSTWESWDDVKKELLAKWK